MPDFCDEIVPVLEAGTYTNYGVGKPKPGVVTKNKGGPTHKSSRGQIKKHHLEVRNAEGIDEEPELTFDGAVIQSVKHGKILIITTSNTVREALKLDIPNIINAAGIPMTYKINNNPKRRNRENADFLISITDC